MDAVIRPRAVLSWSSGKDCGYALHEVRRHGLADVVAALTTTNESVDRVAMHGTRGALMRAQARRMRLDLIEVPLPYPCSNDAYEDRMATAVAALSDRGITHMIFGDLFLEDVRAYREARLQGTGITPVFPLWGRDTATLAREIIAEGFDARIVTVDPVRLDPSFCGRRFEAAFLGDLPPGVDPCGENGEFHTAVVSGPIFDAPIAVDAGETITRDGFVFTDLCPL